MSDRVLRDWRIVGQSIETGIAYFDLVASNGESRRVYLKAGVIAAVGRTKKPLYDGKPRNP